MSIVTDHTTEMHIKEAEEIVKIADEKIKRIESAFKNGETPSEFVSMEEAKRASEAKHFLVLMKKERDNLRLEELKKDFDNIGIRETTYPIKLGNNYFNPNFIRSISTTDDDMIITFTDGTKLSLLNKEE